MEYILDDTTVTRLATFARNVWGVNNADPYEAARGGIAALRQFYHRLGLPAQLSQVGIDTARFDEITQKSITRGGDTLGQFKPLTRAQIKQVLMKAA